MDGVAVKQGASAMEGAGATEGAGVMEGAGATEGASALEAASAVGPTPSLRIRGTGRLLLALVLVPAACADGPTALPPEGSLDLAQPWPVAEPAAVSMDASVLSAAADSGEEIEALRSLLVARRGKLVLERYYGGTDATDPADVRSVTKSVVSLLTGIALERGELESVDQSIAEILASTEISLRPEHAAITVEHLLTMTGGFDWSEVDGDVSMYNAWVTSSDPVAFLLERDLVSAPGTEFRYNSAAVHLLSRVLEAATGSPVPAYADRVLFGPLGIGTREWESLDGGGVNGGSGLDLLPRDLAKLGQLLIQRGWSGGRSIVPDPWVEASTARRFGWAVESGPIERLSYGMLWWLDLDRDAFFAEGYRGQFLYVVPRLELVVVATCDTRPEAAGSLTVAELRDAVAELIVDRVLGAVP